MLTPWVCWNATGDSVSNEIISSPGKCVSGTSNSQDWPQISISAAYIKFTYDEIQNNNTDICFNIVGSNAISNVIDHNTINNCGPLVTGAWNPVNEDPGWHDHGVYDYGVNTVITNNYIYGNSRNGILEYPSGSGAIIEHNIIDDNGNGITLGGNTNVTIENNIISNSGQLDFSVDGSYAGINNLLENNCIGGNLSGDINPNTDSNVEQKNNLLGVNPMYTNAATHNYKLLSSSKCIGDGPDTAQP